MRGVRHIKVVVIRNHCDRLCEAADCQDNGKPRWARGEIQRQSQAQAGCFSNRELVGE